MESRLGQFLWKPAGWLALAYLGYWGALLLGDIAVPLAVSPLPRAALLGWEFTPFRARVQTAAFPGSPGLVWFVQLAPLLIEVIFLVALAFWGARIRRAAVRIWLHFTGVWVVLFLASQVGLLAYLGRGRFARLLAPLAVQPPLATASRLTLAVIASLLLLSAARPCAARLLADTRNSWLPQRAWPVLLAFLSPVLLILAAAFNVVAALRFPGLRAVFYLIVPAAACLLVGLLGLTWKRATPPVSALGVRGAILAVGASAALFVGLQNASTLRLWSGERGLSRATTLHYEIVYDPKAFSSESVRAFANEREQLLAAMAARLGVSLDGVWLRLVLYSDLATFRAATRDDGLFRVDGTTVRAVRGGWVQEVDPGADASALLTAVWGRSGWARMGEWVARWLAGGWRGRAVEQWAGQIEAEVGHHTLAELVGSSSDGYLSPLVRNPLAAAWIANVFDRARTANSPDQALAAVRKLYAAKPAQMNAAGLAALLGSTPAQLEEDWRHWTARLAAATMPSAPAAPAPLPTEFFYRGISFSHEGWTGGGGGYVSQEARAQLRRLHAMGANAVAVVPYGFARGADNADLSYTGTDETDVDLAQGLHMAHDLGMKVMLKPQLWVSRGEFTGAIRFDNPALRADWMRRYREFILHYARLAELEGFDLFCIGNELEGLTPYAGDWRRLIADVRRVYHGPLTYAANWGREFESIRFWDALDYIGVNNYYPLAAQASARVEDLLPGAEQLATTLEAASRRWHKPILFTEVGYPSVRGGSSQPWIEDGTRGLSLPEQAAAYEATFRAFAGKPWFRGMFWWKWPSSGRGGGAEDASFTPLGKPAADVLRAWFTRLGNRADPSPTPAP